MSKVKIGVAEGIGITFREDGSVGCEGASQDEALSRARFCVRFGEKSPETRRLIQEWIERMEAQIGADELDKAVDRAAERNLKISRRLKFDPATRTEVEKIIREKARQRLTAGDKGSE